MSLFYITLSNLFPDEAIFLHCIICSGFTHRISNMFHFYVYIIKIKLVM